MRREMKFSTLGCLSKRRIGNPRQDRFGPACYLAHDQQPEVAATSVLSRLERSRLGRHQRTSKLSPPFRAIVLEAFGLPAHRSSLGSGVLVPLTALPPPRAPVRGELAPACGYRPGSRACLWRCSRAAVHPWVGVPGRMPIAAVLLHRVPWRGG